MPELPEVETIVRELQESQLIGAKIADVMVYWDRSIARLAVKDFCAELINQTILQISRRGKFIVFTLSRNILLIHLRMTGKIVMSHDGKVSLSHERVRLRLDDDRYIHFEDQRKFGKWYLETSPALTLAKLGLEPLSDEFTLKSFQLMLQKSSLPIKPFLLNQKYIVGIGNIYADEALWLAKIHPLQKANKLTLQQIKALHKAIPVILQQGIANTGTTLGNKNANYYSVSGRRGKNQEELKVFRQEGNPCPRCHHEIIKIKVAQRGTHLCPYCQKL